MLAFRQLLRLLSLKHTPVGFAKFERFPFATISSMWKFPETVLEPEAAIDFLRHRSLIENGLVSDVKLLIWHSTAWEDRLGIECKERIRETGTQTAKPLLCLTKQEYGLEESNVAESGEERHKPVLPDNNLLHPIFNSIELWSSPLCFVIALRMPGEKAMFRFGKTPDGIIPVNNTHLSILLFWRELDSGKFAENCVS